MKVSCILVLIVLLSVEHDCLNTSQNVNVTEIIDSLLVNYDKRLRPNFNGAPVEVGVTLYVISLRDLSDIDMEYTMDFYFRQFWTDTRLSFDRKPKLESLSLGHEFGKQIWVPDTFFVNEKESLIHSVTTKNEFLRVEHDGKVTRSVRLTVTASCPMNLRSFPMDKQNCELDIESYSHSAKDIRYSWKENGTSVGISDDVSLALFEMIGHEEKTEHLVLITGNYSRLAVEFKFKRSIEFYLCQVYVPCTMLVILSWISLWVNRRAVNVRLALCVLSMLLMTIACQSIGNQIPKTSYKKAIDVFTGVSMTFVFIALVEFAYIRSSLSDNDKDDDFDSKQAKIDKFFRIGYPIAFIVFNIIYWTIY